MSFLCMEFIRWSRKASSALACLIWDRRGQEMEHVVRNQMTQMFHKLGKESPFAPVFTTMSASRYQI